MRSVTSSIRITPELRDRLEEAARQLQSGKNRVIVLAIEEFLDKIGRRQFLDEARRQSILASSTDGDDAWLKHAETSGWK
jgi:predicted transcriptional regulator